MHSNTSEKALEALIEKALLAQGYTALAPADYDRTYCMNREALMAFLTATQPATAATIQEKGEEAFVRLLHEKLRKEGVAEVLRNGLGYRGSTVRLYSKAPKSGLNKKAAADWEKNIFSVTRQLMYSTANHKSLDMVISINGLPVATLELKNEWTGQNVQHAIRQYQEDREEKEPLFGPGRCLVHFAADTNQVYMSSELRGRKTIFLPFNKGWENGPGNPPNEHGVRTAYLWEEILERKNLGRITEHYAKIIQEEEEDGKKKRKVIFPRYHQWRVVQWLLQNAQEKGTGERYLLQHSAGSGKSNSIAWLAYQLTELHNAAGDTPVFDSIIVITDRKVLDKQIRDTIKSFGKEKGLVEAITAGSQQLRKALETGKKIIITTVQKFPYLLDKIGELAAKKFAIIIDEAHSSQGGKTTLQMNEVLWNKTTADDSAEAEALLMVAEPAAPYGEEEEGTETGAPDNEDLINELIERRRMLPNASYFAFTATPKSRTLQVFGRTTASGGREPHDLYPMKQAIAEKFILDVLQNYTTYNSYYKLNKATEGNPDFETHAAQKKLRAYAENHPFSIQEKAKVMIDHFHNEVQHLIRKKARAMVVTRSVNHAIRYYQAINEYLRETGSPWKAIVAFSGKRKIDGTEYDEAALNGFASADIPKQFKKDPYRLLIAADKFQTGFDEPLLHTMYVDKKLGDVQAVQTLSRLNRAYWPEKQDTFVLDFFNSTDDIKKAFEPYYTTTILSSESDPNELYNLQEKLDRAEVYTTAEVTALTDEYFAGVKDAHNVFNARLNSSIEAYNQLTAEEQVAFYVNGKAFMRHYIFLARILDFRNVYWERLYHFLYFLLPKLQLPPREDGAAGIAETIRLDSYQLERRGRSQITLEGGGVLEPVKASGEVHKQDPEMGSLDEIVAEFNRRFAQTSFTEDNKVKYYLTTQLPADMQKDGDTMNAIYNSDEQNARITSDRKVEDLMQDILYVYTELYQKYMNEAEFRRSYHDFIFHLIWRQRPGAGV